MGCCPLKIPKIFTGPFARAGQVVADGNGNATFNTTASYNGFFFSESINAKYQVFPNCTIEFQVEPFDPIFQPAIFEGVIADNKREVEFMIVSPPGQTIHATLVKQNQVRCSEASLGGSYALNLSGSFDLVPFQATAAPGFVRLGKLIADGKGHFTADTFVNFNGFQIGPEEISGTYIVTANCSVKLQYQDVVAQLMMCDSRTAASRSSAAWAGRPRSRSHCAAVCACTGSRDQTDTRRNAGRSAQCALAR